jgi:hypothetical protein
MSEVWGRKVMCDVIFKCFLAARPDNDEKSYA